MINVTASNCAFNIQFCICFFVFFRQLDLQCISIGHLEFLDSVQSQPGQRIVSKFSQVLGRCIDGHARDWHSIAIYQYISIAESRAADVCHTVSARCWALKVSLRTKVMYTTLPNGSGSLLLLPHLSTF